MFEPDDSKYPKNWKEMSFDFRLLMGFHVCMMGLMLVGRAFSIEFLVGFVIAAAVVMAGLSIHHRIKYGWHWPGVGPKGIFGAILALLLGFFFFGATSPRYSPLEPFIFMWYAGGGGMILFGALSGLNVVVLSQSEFQRQCGPPAAEATPAEPMTSNEPTWKKALRGTYAAIFLAVWLVAVGFFWKHSIAFRDGSPVPTADKTEKLQDGSETVYITPEERQTVDLLQYGMMFGIPSAMLLGAAIHFLIGVKLFPNAPTFAEFRDRQSEWVP